MSRAKKVAATIKKSTPAPPGEARRAMPAPLVERAHEAVKAKRSRLVEEARADIALIHRRRQEITESFFDIGEALERLQPPEMAEVLGYSNFAELCEKELAMSPSKARQLIAIARGVKRSDAVLWGQDRAAALLALAEATPEPDSAALLAGAAYQLPDGKTLDVGKAPTAAIWEAAKMLRASRSAKTEKRGRGLTTTAEERAAAARIERAFQDAGLTSARVVAVARNKAGAMVRIERVPLAEVDKVRLALAKVRKDT
jgi:hypothetical protein